MWSEGWSAEGMQAVPLAHLREVMPSGKQAAGSLQDGALIKQMAAVHESRLFCNAAPRQYVAFVAMFRKVFAHRQEQLLEQQSFLKVRQEHTSQSLETLSSCQLFALEGNFWVLLFG